MARRGENIRKRKDGRWEGRYIKGRKSDGSAIWGYIYGHTYPEVKKRVVQCKAEMQQYALAKESPTFQEVASEWERSISIRVKVSTAAHYHYTLNHYIFPEIGNKRIKQLDEFILEQSLCRIVAPTNGSHKQLGVSVAKECFALVRRICKYAAHLRLMRSLELNFKVLDAKGTHIRVLSDSSQNVVREHVYAEPSPRKLGLLLMMEMGLRIGEVCGLQWKDVDFAHKALKVNKTVERIYVAPGKTAVVVQSPKTSSSNREIPIPNRLFQTLSELKKSDDIWILSSDKKPVEPRCYRKSLQCYLKKAGVETVNPHALRHTFATTCLQAGCNIKTLSELLGHATSDITMRQYVHTCWEWKESEINRIFN